MAGRISDFLAEEWLRDLDTCWVALHTDDPYVSGAYASEVFGGGYTRQQTHFTAPDGRTIWNINPITFTGLPTVTITHLAIWDADSNGNYLASIALDTPVKITAGKQLTYADHIIAISLD